MYAYRTIGMHLEFQPQEIVEIFRCKMQKWLEFEYEYL